MKEIKRIVRVRFFPGKREEWKRLTAEAVHIVRGSTGAVASLTEKAVLQQPVCD